MNTKNSQRREAGETPLFCYFQGYSCPNAEVGIPLFWLKRAGSADARWQRQTWDRRKTSMARTLPAVAYSMEVQ
ncbi:hypothetical protein ACFLX4_00330 [Chloroflexota bacterium]